MAKQRSQRVAATIETYINHPYRYGSIVRREGKRTVSWRVRLRAEPGTNTWRTCTCHTYAEACAILEGWNAGYEAQFRVAHPISRI